MSDCVISCGMEADIVCVRGRSSAATGSVHRVFFCACRSVVSRHCGVRRVLRVPHAATTATATSGAERDARDLKRAVSVALHKSSDVAAMSLNDPVAAAADPEGFAKAKCDDAQPADQFSQRRWAPTVVGRK